jgi:hypothetical protein
VLASCGDKYYGTNFIYAMPPSLLIAPGLRTIQFLLSTTLLRTPHVYRGQRVLHSRNSVRGQFTILIKLLRQSTLGRLLSSLKKEKLTGLERNLLLLRPRAPQGQEERDIYIAISGSHKWWLWTFNLLTDLFRPTFVIGHLLSQWNQVSFLIVVQATDQSFFSVTTFFALSLSLSFSLSLSPSFTSSCYSQCRLNNLC